MKTILKSNLCAALYEAIQSQKEREKGLGYDRPSALVAGWEEILKALQMGEEVRIK